MKTSFGIFLRDLKALGRNPAALFVILALLVLPGLYAWYCIVANWDPYAHTENVPIAVVNEDEGATSDLTGEVNIGKQVGKNVVIQIVGAAERFVDPENVEAVEIVGVADRQREGRPLSFKVRLVVNVDRDPVADPGDQLF